MSTASGQLPSVSLYGVTENHTANKHSKLNVGTALQSQL